MKYSGLFLVWFFSFIPSLGNANELNLMPYPQTVEMQEGKLVLDKNFSVAIDGDSPAVLRAEVKRFLERVKLQTALPIKASAIRKIPSAKKNSDKESSPYLHIQVTNPVEENGYALVKDESYRLQISATHISLTAKNRVGAVRGMETLLQLIGLQSHDLPQEDVYVPQLVITDAPRFNWRGVLLDSSRHFLSVDTLKRQLDGMAAAKYNIFHWHLTDDQGWRMESKAYPKLHKLASADEYYSQKQIREIIAYANQRGIHVLPEIDIPGHASAIALAYPELVSAPGPYKEELRWGVHKPTLNPTDEKVYEFVDAIIAEVSALFPFEYVHIGGDEVDPEQWNTSPAIQQFMKEHGLTDHRALQAYFNRRVVKILEQHQRKMIGWDEIQHPELPKNIAIQSWQGPDAVSDAISHGFQAILSTGYYLDQPQPASYHYRNDPIPTLEDINAQIHADDLWQTWSFDIPRKRGSAISGSFTLIVDKKGKQRGFIDFKGKSRRALHNINIIHDTTHFQLDTWMGVFNPRVSLADGELTGVVIVGNAQYKISGKKIAGSSMKDSQVPVAVRQQPFTVEARALVLGGEAALWGELVDDTVIDLRLWPRGFAVGERLWSSINRQDEESLYRRMEKISIWSTVSAGLRHEEQSRVGMQKFVHKKHDIKPLQIFAQAVEQAQYYHRHHEKHVYGTYSKADQLNLFVDTLPAESTEVRKLDLLVERLLSNSADTVAQQQISALLQGWIDNHQPLMSLIQANSSLVVIEPLAAQLHEIARLGLTLIDRSSNAKTLSMDDVQQAQKLLHDAQQMQHEMVVSAAYPIEKLLHTLY